MISLFFDFEYTCQENSLETRWSDPLFPPEIIEVGLIFVQNNDKVLFEYSCYVKPTINPQLSDYCINLLSLNQSDINEAFGFSKVNGHIEKMLHQYKPNICYSWGEDCVFYRKNCSVHHVQSSFFNIKYIDLMRLCAKKLNFKDEQLERSIVRSKLAINKNLHTHKALDDAKDLMYILEALESKFPNSND